MAGLTKTVRLFAKNEELRCKEIVFKLYNIYKHHPFVDDDGKIVDFIGLALDNESLMKLHEANAVAQESKDTPETKTYIKVGRLVGDFIALEVYKVRHKEKGWNIDRAAECIAEGKRIMSKEQNQDYFIDFFVMAAMLFLKTLKLGCAVQNLIKGMEDESN